MSGLNEFEKWLFEKEQEIKETKKKQLKRLTFL